MSNFQKLLSYMFPNEADRTYVLTYLACGLHHYNMNDKCLIFHGRANNGKTMLIKLFQNISQNVNHIHSVERRRDIKISPEYVYVMEDNHTISEKDVNSITSNNSYLIMTCCCILKIKYVNDIDRNIKNKIRCVNFPNMINWKISREEWNSYEDEFKQILDEHYAKFVENGCNMIESENILNFTEKYIQFGDMYNENSYIRNAAYLQWCMFNNRLNFLTYLTASQVQKNSIVEKVVGNDDLKRFICDFI